MLPRERLNTAVAHQEADRVPLGLGGITASSITIEPYQHLLQYLERDVDSISTRYPVQRLARIDEDLLKSWGVDVRDVTPHSEYTEVINGEYVDLIPAEWGMTFRRKNNPGTMFYQTSRPLGSLKDPKQLDSFDWPDPENPVLFEGLRSEAKTHWENGYAVVANHWICGIMELSAYMRGYDQFMRDLVLNPAMATAIMDKVLELKIRFWDKALTELLPYVSVVKNNDDMGSQDGLLISPKMYREYVKPRHVKLFNFLKKRTKGEVKILLHSCGAIEKLIPDFIEEGADILNPVQITSAGMEPRHLKQMYGQDITFWGGGVNTQETLPLGTPAQVKDEVKRLVDIFAPGGGFIFAPTQSIDPGTPPENIVAMLEAFDEVRTYG